MLRIFLAIGRGCFWGFLVFLCNATCSSGESESTACEDFSGLETPTDWTDERALASDFLVYDDPSYTGPAFGEPFLHPLANEGWEDGLYITRDGLNLYAYYMPVDLFALLGAYLDAGASTTFDYSAFLVEDCLGIDEDNSNPPEGCSSPLLVFINGDVIRSRRSSTTACFDAAWTNTSFSQRCFSDQSPVGVLNDDGDGFRIFMYVKDLNEKSEIFMFRNVGLDPSLSDELPVVFKDAMGETVDTSDTSESNPHVDLVDDQEGDDDDVFLLLYDNQANLSESNAVRIFFSFSTDGGASWDEPEELTLDNPSEQEAHAHLWRDPDTEKWWLYYVEAFEGRSRIVRREFTDDDLTTDFADGFSDVKEVVVDVTSLDGPVFGIGEPTLTTNGDLSFVVILSAESPENPNHRLQADPWILPVASGSSFPNCSN